MVLLLENGDYVKDENGELKSVEGTGELLQTVRVVLRTHRRRFYPDKSFGRRLLSSCEPVEQYALEYARQALDGVSAVYVKSAERHGNGVVLTLIINNEERQVTMEIDEIL